MRWTLTRGRPVQPTHADAHYGTPTATDKPRTSSSFSRRYPWAREIPTIDIDRHIPYSIVRCIMSMVSVALLITDIPRSGLGIRSTFEFFPKRTAPDTALFFDPEPYPVLRIKCNHSVHESDVDGSRCTGSDGSADVNQAPAWSYGYDTTSIGLRGFAKLFTVPNFPNFLLEHGSDSRIRDPQATIDIKSVFLMLDGVISEVHGAMNVTEQTNVTSSLWFSTQYRWIDRLHQYLIKANPQNIRWRTHSFHLRATPPFDEAASDDYLLPTCVTPNYANNRDHAFGPYIACDHAIGWKCSNPLNPSLGMVSLREHISLRLRDLQQQYPDLWFDTLLMVAQEMVSSFSLLSRGVLQELDTSEIVVLTRGRRCKPTESSVDIVRICSTVFLDDYRYERNMIHTNVGEWYSVTATLRGVAQVYVWLRVALLLYVSFKTQPRRRKLRHRMIASALSIFKIPFQVVVYGSLVPTVLYVAAYFVDACFIEAKLDALWTTVRGGYTNIDKVALMRACTMQMRNVWLVALLAKIPVLLQTRGSRWRPQMGIRGIRGLVISFVSVMSIFGPYRSLRFRNTLVQSAILVGGNHQASRFGNLKNEAGFGPNVLPLPIGWSFTMTVLALVLMLGAEAFFRLATWWLGDSCCDYEMLFGQSVMVPHSAGTLWPVTALAIRFHLANIIDIDSNGYRYRSALAPNRRAINQVSPLLPTVSLIRLANANSLRLTLGPAASQATPAVPESAITNTIDRRQSIDVCSRSGGVRAVVKLMNITMISDPWTLFRLRIIGVKLYVYRVCGDNHASVAATGTDTSVVILPYSPKIVWERTGLKPDQFSFVSTVNSRDLPLRLLVQCG